MPEAMRGDAAFPPGDEFSDGASPVFGASPEAPLCLPVADQLYKNPAKTFSPARMETCPMRNWGFLCSFRCAELRP